MFAQRVHADGNGHQDPVRRQRKSKPHTGEHDHSAQLVQLLRRKHIKYRQNEDQHQARKLTEKLRDAAVEFSHGHDLGKVVVDHALIQAVGEADRQQGQEELPITAFRTESFLKLFEHDISSPVIRIAAQKGAFCRISCHFLLCKGVKKTGCRLFTAAGHDRGRHVREKAF